MKFNEFAIGQEFWCGAKRWRCTDVGTRVIVAICLEPHEVVTRTPSEDLLGATRETSHRTNEPSWHLGPPYAVEECVFDENDIEGCSLIATTG